jgi:hypothetical protein
MMSRTFLSSNVRFHGVLSIILGLATFASTTFLAGCAGISDSGGDLIREGSSGEVRGGNESATLGDVGEDASGEQEPIRSAASALVNMSCWDVTGWSSAGQAQLSAADCTTIPETTGWIQVPDHSETQTNNIWLRIPLNDPKVSLLSAGWILHFIGSGPDGVPIVNVTVVVGGDPIYPASLLPYPPQQGIAFAGARVRLRHRNTGNCLFDLGQDGGDAHNKKCASDPALVHILDDAGPGLYRLRHEQTGQCLYGQVGGGTSLRTWSCWGDPNMRFQLVATAGGYRVQHMNTQQCVYGNPASGGVVYSGACWNDSSLDYGVDIIQPPSAVAKINGKSSPTLQVCQGSPIVLDGSASKFAAGYFVSVLKSDASWGATAQEYGRWLTASDVASFGPIGKFNLKAFYGQSFLPGQYYRVKLAVGSPWNETVQLVQVLPLSACLPGWK